MSGKKEKKTDRVFIHPTTEVDPSASVGEGTKIWHFSHVMAGASIGKDCTLGQNVFVGRGVRIGDRVKIQNNVSIYERVILEDDVFCGPSMVFTNVTKPRAALPKNRETGFEPTLVRRGATIGANATILSGLTIGEHAFVGAGAVVTGDVPDYALVYGNPARLKGWACVCGETRPVRQKRGRCPSCGRAFPSKR